MPLDTLSKWLNPQYLRTLLLDPDKNKSTCIQISRFVAAYYLDYLLFLPEGEGSLPSLYLWGNIKEEDLKPTDTILDRAKVSSMLPVEYSPALPALLMVKCDSLIEAISYVDHFDDRRTSLVLRLLADSIHNKDLTLDFIKTMIVENLPLQIAESVKSPKSPTSKFSQNFTESIFQLDVALQDDLLLFLEHHLISTAEFVFSELPLESEEVLPNPIYEAPGDVGTDSEESKAFFEIYEYVQILLESYARSQRLNQQIEFMIKTTSVVKEEKLPTHCDPTYTLHRVLLLMLRITYRHLFSVALRENHSNLGTIAERYKGLLNEEKEEHLLLKEWVTAGETEDMNKVQAFFDWVNNNYVQASSLPPLSPLSREQWLRRIVLNSTTNHRDIRQERTMDWFRSVCHPKHRVCDVTMSQMLFINTQWTSPGFTFIQPGCLALRLSIHPHDLCLGTTTAHVNFSASARDILYSSPEPPQDSDSNGKWAGKPSDSPDLISKFAAKHDKMTREMVSQTTRYFSPLEEQLRVFSRQQYELQRELDRESEFLRKQGHYHYPENGDFKVMRDAWTEKGTKNGDDLSSKHLVDEALAKQLNLLNEKLDEVVKGLADRQKSMYIREEDEESEISEIPLEYDDAPVGNGQVPVIEKLDFGMLSSRTPAPIGDFSFKDDEEKYLPDSAPKTPTFSSLNHSQHLSTAKSISNPLFKQPRLPFEWMKLLPLETSSARQMTQFSNNLLTYNKKPIESSTNSTPRQEDFYGFLGDERRIVSERGIGTQTTGRNSTRSGETQTMNMNMIKTRGSGTVGDVTRKVVNLKSVKRLSQDDMKMVMDRVEKY